MLKQESSHPWSDSTWSLVGLVPGMSQDELAGYESQGELHIWPDLLLNLYILHCDSYYHNLISEQPKVYLVCNQDEEGLLKPVVLTVDYDEAASYMETNEQVFNTQISADLCQWVEQFVLTHYQPEERKVRRRKKLHDESKGHARRVR